MVPPPAIGTSSPSYRYFLPGLSVDFYKSYRPRGSLRGRLLSPPATEFPHLLRVAMRVTTDLQNPPPAIGSRCPLCGLCWRPFMIPPALQIASFRNHNLSVMGAHSVSV